MPKEKKGKCFPLGSGTPPRRVCTGKRDKKDYNSYMMDLAYHAPIDTPEGTECHINTTEYRVFVCSARHKIRGQAHKF